MGILLFNAGSSSRNATLKNAADGSMPAHGLADWAGSTTQYQFTDSIDRETLTEVSSNPACVDLTMFEEGKQVPGRQRREHAGE
jgi:acetate kinase